MNVMKRFTLRSLGRNKKRTIVTIIGVVISVAMITAVTTLTASFLSYLQRGVIADSGCWHAELTNVPVSQVVMVANSNDVDTAVLSRDIGFAQIPDSEGYSKQYFFLREYDSGGYAQMSVRLLEGRLPQKPGEVLMSQSILQGSDLDYAVGNTLTLTMGTMLDGYGQPLTGNDYATDAYDDEGNIIGSPSLVPGKNITLTIVGVMERPTFESGWSTGYGLLGYVDEAALSPADRVNIYITVPQLSRDIYSQVSTLVDTVEDGETGAVFHNDLLRFYGVVEWDNVNTFIYGFMTVILVIIVIASVSLIYNAFAMSVSERARQLGLLASVGATRQQKRASVYFEGLFVGAIGIPLGVIAGIGGMGVTLAAIQPLMDSFINLSGSVKLTLVVPLSAIALAVLFAVITIFVSVYRPARRASRIMPIDAIRQTQEVRLTRRSVKTSSLTRRIFGFEAEIALKNLKRSRKKYRATVVSLVISLVLFLTVSSYANTFGSFSDAVSDGYNYDITVQYQNLSDAQRENTEARITALELVDDFSGNATLDGFTWISDATLIDFAMHHSAQPDGIPEGMSEIGVSLVGLNNTNFEAYAAAVGINAQDYADTQNPKAILINYGQDYDYVEGNNIKKTAGDVLNVKPGDSVKFTARGIEEPVGPETALTLGAVTKERPMGVLTGSFSYVTLVTTLDVWNDVLGSFSETDLQQLKNSGNPRYATFLTAQEDQRLVAQINEITQTLPASSYYVHNIKDMARSEQSLATFLGVFVYGFIVLISLICIANIFNTVSTNIGLRRREFAMLRSVGMTPRGFNRMMRFESVFYGLKGLLWGLPISLLIALLLYNMQTDVLGIRFTLPWISYAVAILMILVIVLASMAYSTHRIKKENIIDELRQETF